MKNASKFIGTLLMGFSFFSCAAKGLSDNATTVFEEEQALFVKQTMAGLQKRDLNKLPSPYKPSTIVVSNNIIKRVRATDLVDLNGNNQNSIPSILTHECKSQLMYNPYIYHSVIMLA